MLRIGTVHITPPTALAPMAGITDHPFRLLVKEQGCGLVFSEMISARGLLHAGSRLDRLFYFTDEERPIAVQLFGAEPAAMAQAAVFIATLGADLIDLNFGCPAPKVVRSGKGGALLKEPRRCREIVKTVVDAVSCPVTVKIRSGWDETSVNAVEIALAAEEAGAAAVIVHSRTVVQGFRGEADWGIIRAVKKAVTIPVIGNGDVTGAVEAIKMLKFCGCDGVMIGRGALGNPWIFNETRLLLERGEMPPPPTVAEKKAMLLRHLDLLCRFKGEKNGVRQMRKHAAWYLKGIPGAARLRDLLVRASSREQMIALVNTI